MPMAISSSSQSFSSQYNDQNGSTAFVLQAKYSGQSIMLTVNLFNKQYASKNKDEIEIAIEQFTERLNQKLSENNLPSIHTK